MYCFDPNQIKINDDLIDNILYEIEVCDNWEILNAHSYFFMYLGYLLDKLPLSVVEQYKSFFEESKNFGSFSLAGDLESRTRLKDKMFIAIRNLEDSELEVLPGDVFSVFVKDWMLLPLTMTMKPDDFNKSSFLYCSYFESTPFKFKFLLETFDIETKLWNMES